MGNSSFVEWLLFIGAVVVCVSVCTFYRFAFLTQTYGSFVSSEGVDVFCLLFVVFSFWGRGYDDNDVYVELT